MTSHFHVRVASLGAVAAAAHPRAGDFARALRARGGAVQYSAWASCSGRCVAGGASRAQAAGSPP